LDFSIICPFSNLTVVVLFFHERIEVCIKVLLSLKTLETLQTRNKRGHFLSVFTECAFFLIFNGLEYLHIAVVFSLRVRLW
jgi:hypothetical protein